MMFPLLENPTTFERRAAAALTAGGAKVVRVQIRRRVGFFGCVRDVLTFCADCPCGNRLVLSMDLGDMWKSRFSRIEQNLSQNFEQHLRSDGILPEML
jgi:hypothetical protein